MMEDGDDGGHCHLFRVVQLLFQPSYSHNFLISPPPMSFPDAIFPSLAPSYTLALEDIGQGPLNTKALAQNPLVTVNQLATQE